ncbi:MAG: hypothetical protein Q9227_000785 [Pyrenula ochraceoflavens]
MGDAFSRTGYSHTFDAKADGYIKAEGINALLLKPLEDAIKDGDPIRAVIRGTATNSDGKTLGIANPSAEAQAAAIRRAYANAGITDLAATSYLECHGTGTLAGDPVEVQAASSVLCETRQETPLLIGSIKSNVGHSECSAGISGLIKVVLALEKGLVPGTPSFITPNPMSKSSSKKATHTSLLILQVNFNSLRVRASRTLEQWPSVPLRRASINSFGFGGSNAHAVLEEAKPWAKPAHVSSFRPTEELDDFFTEAATIKVNSVLVISANDETSLLSYAEELRRHLLYPAVQVDLRDVAYTLSDRRTRYSHRGFIVTNKTAFDPSAMVSGKKMEEKPKIGFVFTGQGAQWPQMGRLLLQNFPVAEKLLRQMDSVLQQTYLAPSWSLIRKFFLVLAERFSVDLVQVLRQPALSQPLVTALQIILVEILKVWGVRPVAVAGHSSGEIAAAYCAGYLSIEEAMKAAFYRGQAAVQSQSSSETSEGMLAVGVSAQVVARYLTNLDTQVEVACYNSPNSVTLSGKVDALAAIRARLEADGHFARMLHVNLAYHSRYMIRISDAYRSMLDEDFRPQPFIGGDIAMFSSVLSHKLDRPTDANYWEKNMTSPVYFDQATREMIQGANGANFLIEIGPSGALANPISEIKASIPKQRLDVQYFATMQREQENLKSLFEVAGRLFIAGADVEMNQVNGQEKYTPAIVTDLPNYVWDHTTRYWHESEASKDWRFRLFPPHDLIGSKILGTSWKSPIWKKDLKVDDIPWLKDHKLGPDIVVPGAAMVVMAVEAMAQQAFALRTLEDRSLPERPCYRIRNATFLRALVLEEGKRQPIMISLAARKGSQSSWHEFTIRSLVNSSWVEHSTGLVRVEKDPQIRAPKEALKPLVNSTPGVLWYQAMEDVGYALGPAFQKHLEAESLSGSRNSRSIVSLREPRSAFMQSKYQMHPTSVDGILQACAPALWNGNRTNINAVIVPAIIDDIVVCTQPSSTSTGMAVISSSYTGLGNPSETKNYTADVDVYDNESGLLLFRLSKLHTSIIDTRAVSHNDPIFCSLSWKPDITFVSSEALANLVNVRNSESTAINTIIELVAFKKPNPKVLEAVMLSEDSTSVWMNNTLESSGTRATHELVHFAHVDPKASLAAQDKYGNQANVKFSVNNISDTLPDKSLTETGFDLMIVRMCSFNTLLRSCHALLRDGANLLLIGYKDQDTTFGEDELPATEELFRQLLATEGIKRARRISTPDSSALDFVFIAEKEIDHSLVSTPHNIHLLNFAPLPPNGRRIVDGLELLGWNIFRHNYPFSQIKYDSTLLILDDPTSPLLSTVRQDQWATLQTLINAHNKILWLTEGSQLEVSRPGNAQIHGLMRTIRDEDPSTNFTTLDVEDYQGNHTIDTIHAILESLHTSTFRQNSDYEFVERNGQILLSRVTPDHVLTSFAKAEREGAEPITRTFQDVGSQVRLCCERVGDLDSLKYRETSAETIELQKDEVEIEICAAGLNFKDIAISTGLIPGDERLLGFEGAGTVKRSNSDLYCTGERVLFTKAGSFANRIIAETELVHPIPDSMSFDEAATLGALYPVAIYCLFDLANTRKGQRVLVHSAAGGIGIACIQLCRYVGTEIYATVGNQEKRDFLLNTFQIPPSRIFNSRDISFAAELMDATNGEGVDVILNSLTGDLLEESWNCVREGGTMVEVGKRDIIERNSLPMAPFARNVSYRSFDISHRSVSRSLMARLLNEVFDLLAKGHIEPIRPITIFSFDDITSAFRYMRDGKHIGKIVISNSSQGDFRVPIRPALQSLKLRHDTSYLIVGGLKGLCGSIALSFARHGAKHVIVMGRSGFDDQVSQRAIRNIEAEGCGLVLVKGDVTVKNDVKHAFSSAPVPIGGIVQGAMVVRGKLYQAMTAEDYHVAVACKISGTWNLHNIAQEENLSLDFFSMLSSTSGVAGQSGQANYVAANAFLDAFANYRRRMGLRANSIALGPMWDVGYMSRNKDTLPQTNTSTFTTISESLFHKIIEYSILQQVDTISEASASHLITGMAIPLKESSTLRSDARFSPLFGTAASGPSALGGKEMSKELQLFNLQLASQADIREILSTLIDLISHQLSTKILRLSENDAIDPAKALRDYGMESLAAVELRNWVRMELRADVTMLEILDASSLNVLCGKILSKIQQSSR